VGPLSSIRKAQQVSEALKSWIEDGWFFLTAPIERLPSDTVFKPMKQAKGAAFVENIVHEAATCTEDEDIEAVAARLINRNANPMVVVDGDGRLAGIITSWDLTKSIANGSDDLGDYIVRDVHTASINEPLEAVSKRLAEHNISALPVINGDRRLLGIVTSEDISKLVGGRRLG